MERPARGTKVLAELGGLPILNLLLAGRSTNKAQGPTAFCGWFFFVTVKSADCLGDMMAFIGYGELGSMAASIGKTPGIAAGSR